MPVSRKELERIMREHVRSEGEQDYDVLRGTLHHNVEYEVKAPCYPDDPNPYGLFKGADVYIEMWKRLFQIFVSYKIEIDDLQIDDSCLRAWVRIKATAIPREDFNGLPKGKPMNWWSAAQCDFDHEGRMVKETVYGSFPPVMAGYNRMKEFVGR